MSEAGLFDPVATPTGFSVKPKTSWPNRGGTTDMTRSSPRLHQCKPGMGAFLISRLVFNKPLGQQQYQQSGL
jgi:hypothetical protein